MKRLEAQGHYIPKGAYEKIKRELERKLKRDLKKDRMGLDCETNYSVSGPLVLKSSSVIFESLKIRARVLEKDIHDLRWELEKL